MSSEPFLKPGDVFEVVEGDSVKALVPNHHVYSNCKGDWSLTKTVVTVKDHFMYLAGRYIVTDAKMDGGGTGHGPHDIYPDGHHVTATAVGNRDQEISFYQSGCFSYAWDRNVEVIGRAKRQWVIEDVEAAK